MTAQHNLPAAEPKNGDFVAYIAEIERRQMESVKLHGGAQLPARTAPAPSPAPTSGSKPLTAAQAEALRARLRSSGDGAKAFLGAALLGLFGLFFAVQGLLGDGGLIATVIAALLLWRAWVAGRKAFSTSLPADQATRIVAALRDAQRSARK